MENEQTPQGENSAIQEFGQMQLPQLDQQKSPIHIISIIGQIEGHTILPPQNKATKYEHIIPQLVAVEQSENIKGLLLIMNTIGGDVEAGLAISEMIKGMSKASVSLVIGGGHSIGVPLAASTDYSFISDSASMTVHPIRMNGLIITVPQTFDYFNKMQERIIRFVSDNSKISENDFRTLMFNTQEMANDTGTTLIGKEAVEAGIIDEVGGIKQALDKLNQMISQ